MTKSWLITTSTYGTWLPGDPRGSTDSSHRGFGEQPAAPNPALQAWAARQLKCPPIHFNRSHAAALLQQFRETSDHRGWKLHAAAIMATHCHVVLSALGTIESDDILRDLKSYGSRRLSQEWGVPASETWWTESGSRRELSEEGNEEGNVEAAVRYVAEQQSPLALWVHKEFEWLVPADRRELMSWPEIMPGGSRPPLRKDGEGNAAAAPRAGGVSPLADTASDRHPHATSGRGVSAPWQGDVPGTIKNSAPRDTSGAAVTATEVHEKLLPRGSRPPLRKEQGQGSGENGLARGLTPPAQEIEEKTLRQLDNAHVWHPFTAMSAYREEAAPIIVDAEGFYLIDSDGRRYLDGHSSLWCNIHGHRVPAIDQAIRQQLDHVAHTTLLGLSNQPSIELAAELVRRVPAGLNKVFYADCGAAGVEVALKLAFQYHRQKSSGSETRNLFACLGQAYHGDTVGTISLGGIDRFHSLFGSLMYPALRIPTPSEDPGFVQLERLIAEHADQLAGFVIEPLVQAAAGILVHPPGYLTRVRELTRKYGILLIADEIAVGFGRTGKLFACEHEQVSPDILILSKGLTGGYLPLAATLVTDEVESAFLGDPWEGRTFQHGHTYTGNPLACAAALASMRLIDENNVLDSVLRIEQVLHRELCALNDNPHVVAVRQRGAMVGIELIQHRAMRTPFPASQRTGHQVTLACRRRGVILRNIGDTIVVMPAPAMPVELVTRLCQAVVESVTEVVG